MTPDLEAELARMDAEAATAPVAPRLTYHIAAALADNPEMMTPPAPLVAPLFYLGRSVLLSGREKVGKSSLIGELVAAVTRGGAFLGEPATSADVIIYSLDEPLRDTVQRLATLGADLSRVLVCTEPPTGTELTAKLAEVPAKLVIVDTINEMTGYRDLKDASAVLPILKPLIDAARAADICFVVLGHATKGAGTYTGAVQIGGIFDAPLTLRTYRAAGAADGPPSDDDDTEPDDGRRVLEGRTRWAGALKLRLSRVEGRYCLGDAPAPLSERILRVIADDDITASALAERLGIRASDARHHLQLAVDAGHVRRGRKGEALALTPAGHLALSGAGKRPAYRPDPSPAHNSGRYVTPLPDDAGRIGTYQDASGTVDFREPSHSAHLGLQNGTVSPARPDPLVFDGTEDAA